MNEVKHTPGPWTFETVQTQSGICHKIGPFPWKNGKQNHACIYVDYASTGDIEKELAANARLMVAAPEMLEALEFISSCQNWEQSTGEAASALYEAASMARAAIAKATQ